MGPEVVCLSKGRGQLMGAPSYSSASSGLKLGFHLFYSKPLFFIFCFVFCVAKLLAFFEKTEFRDSRVYPKIENVFLLPVRAPSRIPAPSPAEHDVTIEHSGGVFSGGCCLLFHFQISRLQLFFLLFFRYQCLFSCFSISLAMADNKDELVQRAKLAEQVTFITIFIQKILTFFAKNHFEHLSLVIDWCFRLSATMIWPSP